ncbi:glycosyl transferase [Pseudooceanicola sp. GBMRC 2024]|uniref:Peptide O-xylosyltransferase n=1 Tax=Pseudooceanicola albus TaxID=2692189 RepID=A0A6L7FYD3_9RHOB|nr:MULTISPECIES: beta-1,6-N-acetylglucosaminyltransferase [Pseudooceanicola]MXN16689.1 glycosyl transferase [Pseudooceanicola albus]
MLVHTALGRAEQVARHWSAGGCPVVIHCDARVPDRQYGRLQRAVADDPGISFARRYRCEWGTWGLVAATQDASERLLRAHPDIGHVFLTSGSCLPLRPVQELVNYLAARPMTDFIESATTEDVTWPVGGLDRERFLLRFPFSWKRHRRLFDGYVRLQRRVGFSRRLPPGIVPHMGSQWWCLTRRTLSAILEDPNRRAYDRYFRKVWIPDESYFQTLARRWSRQLESRSLTLSKFDFQGKPHIFYDDHLQLLRRSDCFVARKIWPRAGKLYRAFLTDGQGAMKRAEPNPGKIDRIFEKASGLRTRGRTGLYMQSRYPNEGWDNGLTAGRYSVFQGFTEVFEDFVPWLERHATARVHGHLFGPGDAAFAGGQQILNGGLLSDAVLRDYAPRDFLTNLIWNTRGERQVFQFSAWANQALIWDIAKDPNAHVSVITGAWAVPLSRSELGFAEVRAEAARLQKQESAFLEALRSPYARARVMVWSMAHFIRAPMVPLQSAIEVIGPRKAAPLAEAPTLVSLEGFPQFLQTLKNNGMHPFLVGDFPTGTEPQPPPQQARPYLVRQ